MGELTRGDAAMLARMRAAQNRGKPASRRLPLPPGASYVAGDVHRVLREGGYVGGFTVGTDEDGERFAVLTEFDKSSAWTSGIS